MINIPIPLKIPINAFGVLYNIYWDKFTKKQLNLMKNGIIFSRNLTFKLINVDERPNISSFISADIIHLGNNQDYYSVLEYKNTNYHELLFKEYHLIWKALLAFRLLKSGDIFLEIVGISYDKDKSNQNIPLGHYWDGIYNLSFNEIQLITKIFTKINKINFDKSSSIRITCDRFDRAYYDTKLEDKLIDLIIGYEALFLEGYSGRGKRKPIAKFRSELLEKNSIKQKEIYNDIIKAYKIRNKVVHGSSFNTTTLRHLLPKIEDYLRRSIRITLL